MRAEGLSARYREDADFQAVTLPYGGGEFALVVVLPRTGLESAGALQALASDPSWLGGSGFRRSRGYLSLPRVTLNGEASLLPVLRALGLAAALEDGDAFAGIAAPPPALSRVVHRTMLKLDEQGTEAAAATAAGDDHACRHHGGRGVRDAGGSAVRAGGAPPGHRRDSVRCLGRQSYGRMMGANTDEQAKAVQSIVGWGGTMSSSCWCRQPLTATRPSRKGESQHEPTKQEACAASLGSD